MAEPLDERAQRRARMNLIRHAYQTAGNSELTAIDKEYLDEWALLQGDYWAGDYDDENAIKAHIAWCAWHIEVIQHEMARRIRSGVEKPSDRSAVKWQARFDAMRFQPVVEGLALLGVELHQQGREWVGKCPWHEDKSPSFSANPQKNVWHCFSCQRGGDLVEFVVLREGKSRGEALSWLEMMLGSMEAGAMNRPDEEHEA